MLIFILLAIFSCIILCYIYIGYPIIIIILSNFSKKSNPSMNNMKQSYYPVTIVLVAYNEGNKVKIKLNNLLEMNYPNDMLSIIIVDDGSNDNSFSEIDEYIQKININNINIKIIKQEKNGKSVGINNAIVYIKDNFQNNNERLVMLCDVRQIIDQNALLNMSKWFTNENVGYVSGELIIPSKTGTGLYWKYDTLIRKSESDFYSAVGGYGPLSIVRLNLIPILPEDLLLDDVYIPMNCIFNKKLVLLEQSAKAYDIEHSLNDELQRKIRTLCGNFQLIKYLPQTLSFTKNPIAFQFWSHKVLRLVAPFFIIILFILSLILSISGYLAYIILFLCQLLFYTFALIGTNNSFPIFNIPKTFVVLNYASVMGLIRFLKKDFRWKT